MELAVVNKLSHIDDFLKNFTSPHTRRAYEGDLKAYAAFSVGREPLALATLISYREHLNSTHSSATTVRRLASVRSFMAFLLERGVITVDFSKHLRLPKVRTETHTQAFTDEEASKVMALPDQNSFYGNLHRFTLCCLFNLGLRRSELVELKFGSISSHRGTSFVNVNGKGGKTRIIPLSDFMIKEFNRYVQTYEKLTGNRLSSSDFLLQSGTDKNQNPMGTSTIYKIVDKYAKLASIERKVSPHSCRATVISQLLENSVSPRDVANFAGHSSIATTVDIYDKKRDAIKNSAALKVSYGS
jgi:site-specific recombinase XerD